MEYYQIAANQGVAEAYQNLGVAYLNGKGVPKNTQKALDMMKKAIDGGSQTAIYNLGNIYSSIGKNEEAILWLRKAAELNLVFAQADLAGKLAESAKTEAEKQEAKQWLEKALAEIKAARKLIEIYEQGSKNIPKNKARKQYWESKLTVIE